MINPTEILGEEKVTKILQDEELSMLKEVKRIFEENHIPFFLACGTALGCARHSGFIPWDDDVDIYVWGTDYQRIKCAIEKDPFGKLRFQDYSTDNQYPYWFPKIVSKDTVLVEKAFGGLEYTCGVYIDVFPLFFASDNRIIRKIQEAARYTRYALIRAYYNESFSSGYRKLISSLVKVTINPHVLQRKLKRTYLSNTNGTSYLVDSGVFHKKALLNRKYFSRSVSMRFEDTDMPMAEGYKQYLTDYYGNYLELPPEKQRISMHHIARLVIPSVPELGE